MMALAPPPPLQIAAKPNRLLFSIKACNKVITMRDPELPNAWPRATAPHLILIFSAEIFNSF